MCLLAIAFKHFPGYPIVVAANRDEFYTRSTDPPRRVSQSPIIFAGTDNEAGGTWLGINQYGLVAAVTNRHAGRRPDPTLQSRGILCLDALRYKSTAGALDACHQTLGNAPRNPFNLIVASKSGGWMLADLQTAARELTPGWHFVANGLPDDPEDARVRRAQRIVAAASWNGINEIIAGLKKLCGDHGSRGMRQKQGRDAICVHGRDAGTMSSTILAVNSAGKPEYYLYADGTPCSNAFRPVHSFQQYFQNPLPRG